MAGMVTRLRNFHEGFEGQSLSVFRLMAEQPDQQAEGVGPHRLLELLLARARERYGTITPCAGKSWEECFMDHGKYGRFLYFNDSTGSTRVMKEEP